MNIPDYKPVKLNKDMYRITPSPHIGKYGSMKYSQNYKSSYGYGQTRRSKKKRKTKTTDDIKLKGMGSIEMVGECLGGLIA